MKAEVLLRLTLLQFDKKLPNAEGADSPEASHLRLKPNYTSTDELRNLFMQLWTEQLARRLSLDRSLYHALTFFLPAQWSGEPCDNYYLSDDTSDSAALQYMTANSITQHFFRQDSAAAAPFFEVLDELVALLQPRLPQLLPTLKEWTRSFESSLNYLRVVFVTLHSALLNSFCELDKNLTRSQHSARWEENRKKYLTAVSSLCQFLDSQLLLIVTRTVAMHFDSACGSLQTFLFKEAETWDPAAAAAAVAALVEKRLLNVSAAVATTTVFGSMYPSEIPRLQVSSNLTAASIDEVRSSAYCYLEKLKAHTVDEKRHEQTLSPDGVLPLSNLGKATNDLASTSLAADVAPVSLDQAYSLIAPSESETLVSRVTAIAPEKDQTLEMVRKLLAEQWIDEPAIWNEAASTSDPKVRSICESPLPGNALGNSKNEPGQLAVTSSKQQLAQVKPPPTRPHKSSHKETCLFWSRVQRKLGLEDVSVQRISDQCKFDNESPYPGVFLVDLDVRNNDRATISFVDALSRLLPNDPALHVSAKNIRLIKEACSTFAEELLEKSKAVQSTLPFLPIRSDGVLLGSLYAVLRADKQFQSLKQIYQQQCQLPHSLQKNASAQALHTNIETLIVKRIRFLSKPAAEDEYSTPASGRESEQASVGTHRWSLGDASRAAPHQTAAVHFEKTEQPRITQVHKVGMHSAFSAPTLPAQNSAELARRRPSVMEALSEARRSVTHTVMPVPPPETRIEKVYTLACRFNSVTTNGALSRLLSREKENFITTLDLSSNYVGVKGLKPVLALLDFNGSHLISLSLCNNNLENEDVEEVCRTLEGPAGENLTHLDLSFNPITSSAFAALQKLSKKLLNLESLQLKATLLPPEAVQDLQRIVARNTAQRCM